MKSNQYANDHNDLPVIMKIFNTSINITGIIFPRANIEISNYNFNNSENRFHILYIMARRLLAFVTYLSYSLRYTLLNDTHDEDFRIL